MMQLHRVMVVEDESLIAIDLKLCLKSLGYDVSDVVATGEDAIECAIRKSPDLILMDIHLQGNIDGIDAASQILASCQIPIVFMSAYTDSTTMERLNHINSAGFISKPLTNYDIVSAIDSVFTD